MNRLIVGTLSLAMAGWLGGYTSMDFAESQPAQAKGEAPVRLGNFSVSLSVKDLAASRAFYEKLGFHAVDRFSSKKMAILQNESCTIGLFQGVIPKNSLTFNPGWDRNCATLPEFDDVRDIQRTIKSRGLTPEPAADENGTGPAFLMLTDPDGNPVLIDQHVPKPAAKK